MHVYYNLPLAECNLFGLFKSAFKSSEQLLNSCISHKCLFPVALWGDNLLYGVIFFFFCVNTIMRYIQPLLQIYHNHVHNDLAGVFVLTLPALQLSRGKALCFTLLSIFLRCLPCDPHLFSTVGQISKEPGVMREEKLAGPCYLSHLVSL